MHTIIAKDDLIKRLRITNGYSIRGFGIKTGLNPVTIQNLEGQKTSPTPSTAKKICNALGVKFDDLFEIVETAKEA